MERQPSTGGLTVSGTLGISTTELDQILDKFTTQPAIEQQLKEMGIVDTSKPGYTLPEITAEMLSTTDSREYTNMYAQQLAWFNYLTPILARVKGNLLQAETQKDLIKAKIKQRCKEQNKLLIKTERLSEDEINTAVLNDIVYQEALLESQKMQQFKYSLEAMVEIAERNQRVVSRQVEIRRQEIEGHQREGNMPQRGTLARPIRR